jgi:hypothetical protein
MSLPLRLFSRNWLNSMNLNEGMIEFLCHNTRTCGREWSICLFMRDTLFTNRILVSFFSLLVLRCIMWRFFLPSFQSKNWVNRDNQERATLVSDKWISNVISFLSFFLRKTLFSGMELLHCCSDTNSWVTDTSSRIKLQIQFFVVTVVLCVVFLWEMIILQSFPLPFVHLNLVCFLLLLTPETPSQTSKAM